MPTIKNQKNQLIMKKIAFIFMILAGSLAFTNCSSDDDNGGADCFDCELLGATLCHTEGDDFYTITVQGHTENVPLEGESWEEIKSDMQDFCAGTGL